MFTFFLLNFTQMRYLSKRSNIFCLVYIFKYLLPLVYINTYKIVKSSTSTGYQSEKNHKNYLNWQNLMF